MCRLFGFRSVIPSQVHRSLVDADNALAVQSQAHPDGWGVAYYLEGSPHVTKSAASALTSNLFRRVSGIVSSETVVAHIRKATQGENSVLNSHPFQYGKWIFAHNGDIPEFERCREAIEAAIAPRLRRFILGETDSERIFFLFLTELHKHGSLGSRLGIDEVIESLKATVSLVRSIADGPSAPSPALLNLLVTNGTTMAAVTGGKPLFWSTYKTTCADRDVCPNLAHACEHQAPRGTSSMVMMRQSVWAAM